MISARPSLAQNSLWMILARFGAQALTVLFTVVLARRLGTVGFGEYAFIAALIYVANSLTTFGTDMVLIREIAARDDLSRLPAALALQLVLSVLLIVAVWSLGSRIPNQSAAAILALRIYSVSLIPLAFFTVFSTALRGTQRMDAYAVLNLIVPALQAGVVLLPGINLLILCTFLLVIQVVGAVIAGWMCVKVLPRFWQAWSIPVRGLYPLLQACAPLALLTVLGMIYQRLGIYMLSTMTNAADTGLFSAAARAVEASKTVHLAVFAALYPAMSLAQKRATHQEDLTQSIRLSRNVLLAGSVLGALILFAFAGPIVALLYGSGYLAAVPALRILSWTLIPFTVNSYLTLSFVASNREVVVGRALAASLLVLLLLNAWWIPVWGLYGSAWAAVVAECVQSTLLLASGQPRSVLKGEPRELPHLP